MKKRCSILRKPVTQSPPYSRFTCTGYTRVITLCKPIGSSSKVEEVGYDEFTTEDLDISRSSDSLNFDGTCLCTQGISKTFRTKSEISRCGVTNILMPVRSVVLPSQKFSSLSVHGPSLPRDLGGEQYECAYHSLPVQVVERYCIRSSRDRHDNKVGG